MEEEEKEEKARSRCASMPTLHTHIFTHTVQAADINNSLLIFICSGEMWGQSNPDTSRLSTCLSLFLSLSLRRSLHLMLMISISHLADTFIQFAVIEIV